MRLPCNACDGTGEIRWNPSSNHDPQCERTAVCSGCGGTGMRLALATPSAPPVAA